MSRAGWCAALAALVIATGVGYGQQRGTPPGTDSLARARGAPSGAVRESVSAGAMTDEPPYRMPPLGEAVLEELHNKLVHFPIVLTLVATVLLVLARRRTELEPLAFWLVWAAALSVLAAYFSGQAQTEEFEHGPKWWLVEIHRKQGITIGIGQALWVLSLLRERTRRHAWLLGVVLSLLVLTAGFLGGLVAHGE